MIPYHVCVQTDNNHTASFIMGAFIPISCIFEVGIFKINFIRGGLTYRSCVFASDGSRKATATELALAEHKRNYMAAIVNTRETCTILKPKKNKIFSKKASFLIESNFCLHAFFNRLDYPPHM